MATTGATLPAGELNTHQLAAFWSIYEKAEALEDLAHKLEEKADSLADEAQALRVKAQELWREVEQFGQHQQRPE